MGLSSLALADDPAGTFNCKGRPALGKELAAEKLAEVQTSYSKINGVSAGFVQTSFLAALEMSELSRGNVWFSKPGKMKWHYSEPEEQVFIINKDSLWLYQPEDNQVLVDNLEAMLLSDLPVSFLLGIGDIGKQFNIEESCKSTDGYIFTLKGKNKADDSLESFKLLVEGSTYYPIGASIKDISGNITSIIFDKPNYSEQLASSNFEIDFPSGTDVYDRRDKPPVSEDVR
ncbi:MAG: outer membrane lipoprotein carrier protein LolA [Bdellovibrionota bacterium]